MAVRNDLGMGLQFGRGSARGRQGYAQAEYVRLGRGRTFTFSIC